ncbi:hypothetical protein FGG08_001972 [Glutinoglossum americanum]|uniref:Uncharacterized protein n=1 Tax=Glutinoglossum americanum TaxID=1670608 RepID=A0A9P8ICM1_9PEZI|nr:hypothetical protein FGG08_001972 [Glutinoglossum americanum]
MARKEATAEELLARAEANGYERGAHREKDSVRDANRHIEKTKKNQDGFLCLYVKFMALQAKEDNLKNGTPIPDEAAFIDTVRGNCLGKGAPAPDIETVKDFIRFYIATSQGRLDRRSTVDSVNTYAEWFFAGFSRVTGTPTDKEERSEVFNWVRRTLTKEGVIVNKRRPKYLFGKEDLTEVLLTLWTKDDLIFIHERSRIQFTFIFHVYCWTGARLGAFFTGGLHYKRWVKNNRDPENISFGAAGREHAKLLYNDGALLLAMAIADEALFGFSSMEDLWKQEIPQGEDEVSLRWNESVKDLPILRKATMKDGVTEEPMKKAAFLKIYQSSLKNAGYLCGTSIYAIRRYLGKMVDGEAAQHDHINYFQGFRKFHEKGLPDKLPAKIEASLKQDSELLRLKSEVQQLEVNENANFHEISMAKAKVRDYLRSLKAKTLQQYKQDWVQNRRDWKVITRGKEPTENVNKTDLTRSLFLVLPERDRLSTMMASDKPLTEGEMRQAMRDLHSLCVRDYTVLYRPGEEPVDGACPVKYCRLEMESAESLQERSDNCNQSYTIAFSVSIGSMPTYGMIIANCISLR